MKGATSRASVEHPCMIHLLPSLRVLLVGAARVIQLGLCCIVSYLGCSVHSYALVLAFDCHHMRASRPSCTCSQINPDGSFVVDRELGSWGSDLLQFEFVDRGEMMSGLMCFTVPAPGSGASPSLLVAEAGNGGCARTHV